MSTIHAPGHIELPIKYWDNATKYCFERNRFAHQFQLSNALVAMEKLASIGVLRDDSQLYRDNTQRRPTLRINIQSTKRRYRGIILTATGNPRPSTESERGININDKLPAVGNWP